MKKKLTYRVLKGKKGGFSVFRPWLLVYKKCKKARKKLLKRRFVRKKHIFKQKYKRNKQNKYKNKKHYSFFKSRKHYHRKKKFKKRLKRKLLFIQKLRFLKKRSVYEEKNSKFSNKTIVPRRKRTIIALYKKLLTRKQRSRKAKRRKFRKSRVYKYLSRVLEVEDDIRQLLFKKQLMEQMLLTTLVGENEEEEMSKNLEIRFRREVFRQMFKKRYTGAKYNFFLEGLRNFHARESSISSSCKKFKTFLLAK